MSSANLLPHGRGGGGSPDDIWKCDPALRTVCHACA